MATLAPRKFKVRYVSTSGDWRREVPRVELSVSGTNKLLVVGECLVLAAVERNLPDSVLWALGRTIMYNQRWSV